MAHTKDGMLILSDYEREGIRACAIHASISSAYGVEGSVTKINAKGEHVKDTREAKKIDRGFEVIKFILEITK